MSKIYFYILGTFLLEMMIFLRLFLLEINFRNIFWIYQFETNFFIFYYTADRRESRFLQRNFLIKILKLKIEDIYMHLL